MWEKDFHTLTHFPTPPTYFSTLQHISALPPTLLAYYPYLTELSPFTEIIQFPTIITPPKSPEFSILPHSSL